MRRSNMAVIPMLINDQPKPARKPAMIPQTISVSGLDKNIARLSAMIKENKKENPKILAILPSLTCSSEKPLARCQALPNSRGEYHKPPKTKAETAAAITANQLMIIESIKLVFAKVEIVKSNSIVKNLPHGNVVHKVALLRKVVRGV